MYAGKIFEQAPTAELFQQPAIPTREDAAFVPDPMAEHGKLYQIPGQPPDLARLPAGCPFAPRCERAEEICTREFPPFVELTRDHHSLCHFAAEVTLKLRMVMTTNSKALISIKDLKVHFPAAARGSLLARIES